MKELAIYGAGGLGREIACLIRNNLPEWNIIGYFDDNKEKGAPVLPFGTVLGGIDDLNAWDRDVALVVAIGDPYIVKTVVGKISNPKVVFPNIIHPSFEILDEASFSIGRGNIITSDCRVSTCVDIGDFNIFNGAICVGHDTTIGSFNAFMPAVRISGGVKIGNYNFFGVSSVVLQKIKIGDAIKLGAGSVLMTKPRNARLYMGNPAKKTEF